MSDAIPKNSCTAEAMTGSLLGNELLALPPESTTFRVTRQIFSREEWRDLARKRALLLPKDLFHVNVTLHFGFASFQRSFLVYHQLTSNFHPSPTYVPTSIYPSSYNSILRVPIDYFFKRPISHM